MGTTGTTLRQLMVAAAFFGLTTQLPVAPAAQAFETATTIKSKLNKAGRQRMLSQRMAKTTCMIFVDVSADAHREALEGAHTLFRETHRALIYGDEKQNLQPEGTKAVLHYMKKVEKAWKPYNAALEPIVKGGPVTSQALGAVAQHNMPVLKTMHKAVGRMERTYSKNDNVQAAGREINFAGAQRMLSQKIAKELCFVSAGLDVNQSRLNLAASIELFDKRQKQLMEGDPLAKVEAPRNQEIALRLAEAYDIWQTMKPILAEVAEGGDATPEALGTIALSSDELLSRAHAAVQAMEAAN